mmetsp:Transcript_4091/g.3423  ORF Transcript_4091/g.3423 Transcript_4091/m.3423 type:complete len:166 (+) Transcript_4091:287-784(+)|eukprot:CAMPEP_0205811558 /NCGR_PEP_ID=MMETSP0205-20121125/15777_1 /ASSEMBLY_ACC=CAM_ASM_000278 /TAXON_ID=36767 /ORGANISM="Euplotes focardii, Strain TN1" /LENGTH=165 /DNA_ID=CAMNT_0053090887 /DNA_START=212 /DNA_END=709 /DNA_ORIENTATION=-
MARSERSQMHLLSEQTPNLQPELDADPLDFFDESFDEEERLGNNTKPCLTNKDFQSLPDLNQIMDDDLPQIPIIKADKADGIINFFDHNPNEEDKNNIEEVHSKSEKSEAVVLQSPAKLPIKTISTDAKTDVVTEGLLKIAQKIEETKSKDKESFEWNNFLVRRA